MAESTKIEWCDATFNPWIGCTKVSPACDHCYAEVSTPSRTLGVVWGPKAERRRTTPSNWSMAKRWNAQAEAFQAQHGRRQRVFCASLADVFDNAVDREWRDDLATLILDTPNLDWLLLTKRIGNAGAMLGEMFLDGPPDNLWLGSTVANQEEADRDIPKLLAVPAAKRFLSMEPLLGPTRIDDIPDPAGGVCLKPLVGLRWVGDGQGRCFPRSLGARIDWVIVGGESGPNARPMHPDWARSVRDQCQAAGVPFFFKQWGEWLPVSQDRDNCIDSLYRSNRIAAPHEDQGRIDELYGRTCRVDTACIQSDGTTLDPLSPMAFRQGTDPMLTFRAGKKAAGRLLDGHQWDEVPR